MNESEAPIRLREAGVGVVIGGIVLIGANVVAAPLVGAAVTIVIGAGYTVVGSDAIDPRRTGLGIVLVGLIAIVEASRFGLGFEPLVIGFFAIAFGMFDIVLGLVFSRIRYRQRE